MKPHCDDSNNTASLVVGDDFDLSIGNASPREATPRWSPRIESFWQREAARRYVQLRALLAKTASRETLALPLANWAVSSDRGLPTALMGCKLGQLLEKSFDDLRAIPSVGVKKINGVIELLARAVSEFDQPNNPHSSMGADGLRSRKPAAICIGSATDRVTEREWKTWRDRVCLDAISREPLGRLVPALRELPRNLWHALPANYSAITLADLRELPSHGSKRVQIILETFRKLHALLESLGDSSTLAVLPLPRFARETLSLQAAVPSLGRSLTVDDLQVRLVGPLVEQLDRDAKPKVAEVVRDVLARRSSDFVHRLADDRCMTRPAVRLALGEARSILQLRWPEGSTVTRQLLGELEAARASTDVVESMRRITRLFGAKFEPVASANLASLDAEIFCSP
jgi:hypothetical protein